jgi:hypothetical protein
MLDAALYVVRLWLRVVHQRFGCNDLTRPMMAIADACLKHVADIVDDRISEKVHHL